MVKISIDTLISLQHDYVSLTGDSARSYCSTRIVDCLHYVNPMIRLFFVSVIISTNRRPVNGLILVTLRTIYYCTKCNI